MDITNIVDVTITRDSVTVSQQGFGTGLILATHLNNTSRVEYYSSLSELALVFPSTTEAYKAAAEVFSQSPAPDRVAVGRRQVDAADVTVSTVANLTLYSVTINGVNFPFTSDASATATEIRDGLIAAVNGGSEPVTAAAVDANTFSLTQDVPGDAWTLTVSARLTIDALTAVDAIADDLTAINNEQSDWYGLVLTDRTSADMQDGAAWVEANKKFFFASTKESDVINVSDPSDTTSLAAILKAAGYDRTACIYHAAADTAYPDAAFMGRILALDPGTYTAKFKNLAGVAVSVLTSTQSINALAKNCNTYEQVAGVNITADGVVSSGEYIDTIIGIDWLEARTKERVFGKLAGALKIPYTDPGIAVVVAEIKAQLQQGVDRTFLSNDPAPTVTAPLAKDVATIDKQARLLPDVKFNATLAGAIHKTEINGVVSV
jgi:hypothetical protein